MNKAGLIALIKEAVREEISGRSLLKSDFITEKLVTIAELAAHLKVTKQTIYNWRDKKYIVPRKIGGRVLYDLDEVNDSITKHSAFLGNGRRYGGNYNATWQKKE
jgi:hypothetical protein